jgi:Mn-dependent DtxR family transcriptional regulator
VTPAHVAPLVAEGVVLEEKMVLAIEKDGAVGVVDPAMKDSIHVSKENYLKAILEAEAEGRQVIPAMLAHWLEVSAPAVTMALKRLKRDGYVEVGADGIVRLTAAGRETAYRTALRHHLIERMLSEVFGMEWHEIHEEAERLEHAVSPAFEAKLREKLGEGAHVRTATAVLPESPAERKRRGECRSPRPPRAALYRDQPARARSQAAAVSAPGGHRPRPEPARGEPELRPNRFD